MKILWVSTRFTRQEAELEKLPDDETVLMVDLDRCILCGACQFACEIEHRDGDAAETGPRIFLTRVKAGAPELSPVRLPLSCRHCPSPCEYYDPQNFWVTCPAGKGGGIPTCDACAERAKQKLMPACATRCSMKCIYFGYAKDLRFALNEKRLRQMGDVLAHVEER
jgi:Fe-S-cluster-containing dehydrogenase component